MRGPQRAKKSPLKQGFEPAAADLNPPLPLLPFASPADDAQPSLRADFAAGLSSELRAGLASAPRAELAVVHSPGAAPLLRLVQARRRGGDETGVQRSPS